jgi:hypothetical protein
MDLGEAKRRVEKTLAIKGYSTQGNWGWRARGKKINERYYLLPIPCIERLRCVLWPELPPVGRAEWYCYISLRIGIQGEKEGEVMVAGGRIERAETQSWKMPTFRVFLPTLQQQRQLILRWDRTPIGEFGNPALAELANYYIRNEELRKATLCLNAITRGELSAASISEALSIAQYKYARTRTEKLEAITIWKKMFS